MKARSSAHGDIVLGQNLRRRACSFRSIVSSARLEDDDEKCTVMRDICIPGSPHARDVIDSSWAETLASIHRYQPEVPCEVGHKLKELRNDAKLEGNSCRALLPRMHQLSVNGLPALMSAFIPMCESCVEPDRPNHTSLHVYNTYDLPPCLWATSDIKVCILR